MPLMGPAEPMCSQGGGCLGVGHDKPGCLSVAFSDCTRQHNVFGKGVQRANTRAPKVGSRYIYTSASAFASIGAFRLRGWTTRDAETYRWEPMSSEQTLYNLYAEVILFKNNPELTGNPRNLLGKTI